MGLGNLVNIQNINANSLRRIGALNLQGKLRAAELSNQAAQQIYQGELQAIQTGQQGTLAAIGMIGNAVQQQFDSLRQAQLGQVQANTELTEANAQKLQEELAQKQAIAALKNQVLPNVTAEAEQVMKPISDRYSVKIKNLEASLKQENLAPEQETALTTQLTALKRRYAQEIGSAFENTSLSLAALSTKLQDHTIFTDTLLGIKDPLFQKIVGTPIATQVTDMKSLGKLFDPTGKDGDVAASTQRLRAFNEAKEQADRTGKTQTFTDPNTGEVVTVEPELGSKVRAAEAVTKATEEVKKGYKQESEIREVKRSGEYRALVEAEGSADRILNILDKEPDIYKDFINRKLGRGKAGILDSEITNMISYVVLGRSGKQVTDREYLRLKLAFSPEFFNDPKNSKYKVQLVKNLMDLEQKILLDPDNSDQYILEQGKVLDTLINQAVSETSGIDDRELLQKAGSDKVYNQLTGGSNSSTSSTSQPVTSQDDFDSALKKRGL